MQLTARIAIVAVLATLVAPAAWGQTACPPCSPATDFVLAARNLAVGSCCQMTVNFPPGFVGYWGDAAPCATQCSGGTCFNTHFSYVEAATCPGASGTPSHFTFSNSMAWDAVRGQLRFDAHGHHSSAKKHISYDVATNTWSLLTPAPSGAHHGYEWNTADQFGNSYVNEWQVSDTTPKDAIYQWNGSSWSIWSCNAGTGCTAPTSNVFNTTNTNTPALEWFPDRNEMIRTEGGGLVRAIATTAATVGANHTPTGPWVTIPVNGTGLISAYHVAREGAAGAIVLIGANLAVTRYNADGTTTPLGDSPCAGDINSSGSNIAADHIGGKLIMNCSTANTWYAYDPWWTGGGNYYTTISGPPNFSGSSPDIYSHAIAEGVPDHGVVAFVNNRRGTQLGGLYIYKHTATAAESDWTARSTAAGVTMATNFNVSADVFDFAEDDPSNYAHETTIKRSGGGSLKILIPNTDGGSGHDWWRFLDDAKIPFGSAESTTLLPLGLRDEYWLTYSVYMPQEYYDWVFTMASSGAKKFSITSSHPQNTQDPLNRTTTINFPTDASCGAGCNRNSSSVPNELVITDFRQTMHPSIYLQNINGSASGQNTFGISPAVTGCSGGLNPDFHLVNSVDAGVQTNTPLAWAGDQRPQGCRNWTAQYGFLQSYGTWGGHNYPIQGQNRTAQAQPWPDPIAAGKRWKAGWNTILYHVKFPTVWSQCSGASPTCAFNGVLEMWMWHPGDTGWTKLFEKTDVNFRSPAEISNGITLNGGVDGYFHWGLWLTPFRTGGVAEPSRPNTYIIYDEVIVSTQPIAAPAAGAASTCGNGVVDGGEQCEPSLTQCCIGVGQPSECQFRTSGACDNGVFCFNSTTRQAADSCVSGGVCQAGGAGAACDDSVACTTDTCNETTDQCDATPVDAACDDTLYCTGVETCNVSTGCVAGTPINCANANPCDDDVCDEVNDVCIYPENASCHAGISGASMTGARVE